MASVLDEELINYFVRLSEPQKKLLLAMMKAFLKKSKSAHQVTIEGYNQELDEAMARIDRGEFVTLSSS